jgi:hypothetical protein
MATNFPELIRTLADAHVEFIIIGGVAARAHGSARFTEDLDVAYRRSAENIRRVMQAMGPKDFEAIAELEALVEEADRLNKSAASVKSVD